MTLDPFEMGRRKQCEAEGSEQRRRQEWQENELLRKKTVGRLFSILSPKVTQLGLAIWLDEYVRIKIDPRSSSEILAGFVISTHFEGAVATSRWDIIEHRGDEGDTYSDLSDEDVFEMVGRYCEKYSVAAREYKQRIEREQANHAQQVQKWKAAARRKFWYEHWFLFACIVMVLLAILGLSAQ